MHDDVAGVLGEQSEALLRFGDPLGRGDPGGDISPGDADGVRSGIGGPDVVVPDRIGQFALVGDVVEDQRSPIFQAVDDMRQQT